MTDRITWFGLRKYRKNILEKALATRVSEMFQEIGANHEITVDEMEGEL